MLTRMKNGHDFARIFWMWDKNFDSVGLFYFLTVVLEFVAKKVKWEKRRNNVVDKYKPSN